MSALIANENIRCPRVVVIDSQGVNIGEFSKFAAMEKAKLEGLDLVQISEKNGLPICKIADFGKMKYENSKKTKNTPKPPQTKEIVFHLNTFEHDVEIKLKKAREFLDKKHRVRITIELHGREKSFKDMAKNLLAKHISGLSAVSKADDIRVTDKQVWSMLHPLHG